MLHYTTYTPTLKLIVNNNPIKVEQKVEHINQCMHENQTKHNNSLRVLTVEPVELLEA